MGKSISAIVLITLFICLWSVGTYTYINHVSEEFCQRIENAEKDISKEEIKEISDDWDKTKKKLMYLMNHRDVEEVSTALLRGYYESASGKEDMAKKEIALAKFLLEELVEREKFSLQNLL